jgi:hypothetical protein
MPELGIVHRSSLGPGTRCVVALRVLRTADDCLHGTGSHRIET